MTHEPAEECSKAERRDLAERWDGRVIHSHGARGLQGRGRRLSTSLAAIAGILVAACDARVGDPPAHGASGSGVGFAGSLPSFVQGAYSAPQSSQSSVAVTFGLAQEAGNLIVVVVGWNDTVATVASVTDSQGNAYALAAGPTVRTGLGTQSIYYAKAIAGAPARGNSVTVRFSTAAAYPDVRLLEYTGVDAFSPLDAVAASTGSGSQSASGELATACANDLLVAGNFVATYTSGPGSGFTSRMITVPDGDIVEDRVAATPGPSSATAPVSPAGAWIMQMVAFRAAGACSAELPAAPGSLVASVVGSSRIDLTWTNTSANQTGVTIERSSDGVGFVQIAVAPGTASSFSDTALSGSTTYFYRVRATGALGDSPYSNTVSATTPGPPPAIASFTATPGTVSPGGVSVLAWDVSGATWLWIRPRVRWLAGSSATIAPTVTTTYTLTAANAAGSTTAEATVTVVVPPAPVIASFTATPGTVPPGGASVLAWSVTGATSLSIDQGIGVVTGASRSVSPSATATYTLTATNAGGSATASTLVTVATPAVPVVESFTATPGTVAPGGLSVLTWSVTGATSVSIDQGIGTVTGTSRSVSPFGTTTYTLTAKNAAGSATAIATVTVGPSGTAVAFPLGTSASGRYLVDQNGAPFRIHGDSPWSLISNLTASDIDAYLADRKSRGFNAILVNLLEHKFALHAPANLAGDYPFTAHGAGSYDFSTPNEAYFVSADAAIDRAAAAGMVVLLDVLYTGNAGGAEGWWTELTNSTNSQATCYQYGRFIGTRWKDRGNIIWVLSGDYTPPAGSEGEARLLQIFQGIRDAGATQLATAHIGPTSLSSDWAGFRPYLQLNGVYPGGVATYAYAGSRSAYQRSPTLPVFLLEPGYEDEGWVPGAPKDIRAYEWWGQLGGIAGVLYGQRDIWPFQTAAWNDGYPFGAQDWRLSLGRPAAVAMQCMAQLLASLPWQELVPSGLSGMKTLVTANGGSGGTQVAAAATPSGRLLLAYAPNAHSGSFSIDMTAMAGTTTARWWDPTSGAFTDIGLMVNSGTQVFSPPGTNAAGDWDWLLVLTSP